jgi:hypothetical protein
MEFKEMIGKTMTAVSVNDRKDEMIFTADDESKYRFFHYQDCCENVVIEDIIGELSDLVGSPIFTAEEISSKDEPAPEASYDSYTWTFYRFSTAKGTVTVRWLGESNGYYSESVNFEECKPVEKE